MAFFCSGTTAPGSFAEIPKSAHIQSKSSIQAASVNLQRRTIQTKFHVNNPVHTVLCTTIHNDGKTVSIRTGCQFSVQIKSNKDQFLLTKYSRVSLRLTDPRAGIQVATLFIVQTCCNIFQLPSRCNNCCATRVRRYSDAWFFSQFLHYYQRVSPGNLVIVFVCAYCVRYLVFACNLKATRQLKTKKTVDLEVLQCYIKGSGSIVVCRVR